MGQDADPGWRDIGKPALAQAAAVGDADLGDLAAAVGHAERRQRPARDGGQGQERRGQAGDAQGERVGERLAEPDQQVLVEEADDHADVRVEMAHHQRGREVDQVVAGDDEDAAGAGDARALQDLALTEIARDERHAAQPGIVP